MSSVDAAFLSDGGLRKPEAGKFRTILPQFLASTAKNFLLLDLGMTVAFPTIVIPALTSDKFRYPDESLKLTNVQASWFGSIALICEPVGSILSGFLVEKFGRKRSMILVNIPHIIGWYVFYNSTTIAELYFATILLGLGVGFMEAPVITYVGEICQPSVRGILISYANITANVGVLLTFFLGAIMTWRSIALASILVPIIGIISICFIPETPYWLLSRNRKTDALKSLQWLRGWVSPNAVENEFKGMLRHRASSQGCTKCERKEVECRHSGDSLWKRLRELSRRRTFTPFVLILVLFGLSQCTGLSAMRPYMIQIFQAYQLPIDPKWATVMVGVLGLWANILCMTLISFIGKRRLLLASICVTSASCLALALYAAVYLPAGLTSFSLLTTEVQPIAPETNLNVIPAVLFFILTFATNIGVIPIPWILLSEVFPFKARGLASGLAAALNYLIGFIATKTYYDLETNLSLSGIISLYGIIGIVGCAFVFYFIPETENYTLEDIELYFTDKNRKWTDIRINSNRMEQPYSAD